MSNRVMVINSSREYDSGFVQFPPIGTCGSIISELDEFGEYDVMFDNYPCPDDNDPSWITHKSMIVFIDLDKEIETQEHEAFA